MESKLAYPPLIILSYIGVIASLCLMSTEFSCSVELWYLNLGSARSRLLHLHRKMDKRAPKSHTEGQQGAEIRIVKLP
jgi:hypothetical protein